jgi:DNA mismatch repair protein MutS2
VCTDIGDAQNLEKNLSTFSGHLVNLVEFLQLAAAGTLLLIDEVAVGTDPGQGAALAQAVLEALAEKHVTAIVTTHYDALKALATSDGRFANASVGFDVSRMEPTFKLHLGVPGGSGAFAVARRVGFPATVVLRSEAILGAAGVRVEDLLANVAEQRRRLELERAAVLAELEQLESERVALRRDRDRTLERYERQARSAHGEAVTALKSARREIDLVRSDIKRRTADLTQADVAKANRRVMVAASAVAKAEPRAPGPPGRVPRDGELLPGTAVLVKNLGRAHVVAPPDKGKVEIRFGAMRSTVELADVLIDSHRKAQERKEAAVEAPAARPTVVLVEGQVDGKAPARTSDATVDVRGMRLDEAVAVVDRFLDESMIAERDVVFIIHGHGTGALRSGLRQHLPTHPAIKNIRAGEKAEGGDGVTLVWLKG